MLSRQNKLLHNTERNQPLINIPQANVKIYPQYMSISNIQPYPADLGKGLSYQDARSTISDCQQANRECIRSQKIIHFNNNDFAFNIVEDQNTLEIHNITNQTMEFSIYINERKKFFTIQSLLRKKMCEMGFDRRYKKLNKLGSGATAEVFLVSRISDGKLFAAKIISLKNSSEKEYEAFINEAKLLRLVQSKNIVSLESLYIQKKFLIEVLQYLEGGTLLQTLKNKQCSTSQERWFAIKDLAEALEHLRQKRILHRDLKLQNILIRKGSWRDQFVLTDFGLAVWCGEVKPQFERCGTPGYIAPEVLTAEKGCPILDHRIDIFSFGVIAHLIFLLEPLFYYKGNIKELLKLNKKACFSLKSPLYNSLTPSQLALLEMCLKIDINERATSSTILKFLQNIVYDSNRKQKKKYQSKEKGLKKDMKVMGVDVKIKKAASLIKKNIKIDLPEQRFHSTQKRQFSAKKVINDLWKSFTTPKKSQVNSRMKIKQNSVEKHKRLKDFFD